MAALRRRRKTDGRMSLGDHLRELRRRFVVAAVAIAAGSVLGWVEYDRLFEAMMAPMRKIAAEHQGLVNINFGGITQPFRRAPARAQHRGAAVGIQHVAWTAEDGEELQGC